MGPEYKGPLSFFHNNTTLLPAPTQSPTHPAVETPTSPCHKLIQPLIHDQDLNTDISARLD